MRVAFATLAAGVALVAAGCGGGGGGGGGGGSVPAGASLAPADTPLFFYANTDFAGDQWTKLDELSKKFPDRDQLIGLILSELRKQGIDFKSDIVPAVGPEVDGAFLSFAADTSAGFALTRPDDRSKLEALLKKLDASDPSSTTLSREVAGWTVVSDKQSSLDAAAQAAAGASLADDNAFKSVMGELPSDALLKLYINGQALGQALSQGGVTTGVPGLGTPASIAASLAATPDGLELLGVGKGGKQQGQSPYQSAFVDEVPAGALAFLSLKGIGSQLEQAGSAQQVAPYLQIIEGALGVPLKDVASLLNGETAVWVRPGSPLPEVTLASRVSDEQKARTTLDKLAQAATSFLKGSVSSVDVGGVAAKRIVFPNFAVYYAVFDGKLVITDATSGITGLREQGTKLRGDPVFQEATQAAGMPDKTSGFFYVNIKDTVPLIESFAAIAGESLPPQVSTNASRVRSLLLFATYSSDETRFKGLLEIK